MTIWGLIESYFIDVEEETVVISNLSPAWEGKSIAQLTDFQVGMWFDDTNTARRGVEMLIEKRPAEY